MSVWVKKWCWFYQYETDKRGKPKKIADSTTYELLNLVQTGDQTFDEQEIIDRMMIAFCNETVRCLEDNIVASPAEADMAMIMGVGFPPFRGGPADISTKSVSQTMLHCAISTHI